MFKSEHHALLGTPALLLLVLVAACATSEQALQKMGLTPLTGDELTDLFSLDRTLIWTNARTTGDAIYSVDGSASMNWINGSDTGTWRIEADLFCTSWNKVHSREVCFTVYKTGDMEFKQFWPDGSWNADFSIAN